MVVELVTLEICFDVGIEELGVVVAENEISLA